MKTIKLLHILLFTALICCNDGYMYSQEHSDLSTSNEITVKEHEDVSYSSSKSEEINTVNFYLENSASMNGYLSGEEFLKTMHRIIGRLQSDSFYSYFVNTQEYEVENLLQKIDNSNITQGNISQSDHKFIFTNAIRNATEGKLSVVVTDGIYSVNGKSPAIVAEDIQIAFEKALAENKIETVIIKLSSMFDGYYYSESCPPGSKTKKIRQNRPYYILLFGSFDAINNALNKIDASTLPDFKNMARFFITDRIEVSYTVLTEGNEIHGKLIPEKKFSKEEVHEIKAERYEVPGWFSSTPEDQRYLQFGIAVNYNGLELPESYLTDIKNYKVNSDLAYAVTLINKKSRTIYGRNYTHIIVLKGTSKIYGNLSLVLENNLPGWITDTGIDNDCEIEENETQTYAFNELINGISEAYKAINKSDFYTKFNIKINPL